ncbi:fungal specific transcription factor domain-containing protein [Apiospora hydei]|uniref:Fungal specific transcription factor domain-containing protein n=1 Tax=Apiospora hydei TaxID=1337664 RepID=A0ABR1WNY9_9PEZI
MAPKLKLAGRDHESQTSHTNNNESLEARLKGIEARLDSLGTPYGGDASLASLLDYPPIINNPHAFSSNAMDMSMPETSYASEPAAVGSDSSSSGNASFLDVDGSFPELPPLHEALPVIETYFRDFNSVLPLHHEPTFMKLLHRCYSGGAEPKSRRAEFALVHSVLAIGYRLRPNPESGGGVFMATAVMHPFTGDKSQKCLRNCERLLSELVTRDDDTLGIQALLGLVVLHLANGDEKSAAMLISAAMRLVHNLQMHTRTSDTSFPLREAEQRHNVFWICYCLDKDISLRTSTPSLQLDDDIDLDLPGTTASSASPENMFGIVEESEDQEGRPPPFHYLRARVQLAFIEGQIYDSLYSVRSLKTSPEQRKQQVARLDTLLDTWRRSSLPSPPPPIHDKGRFVADEAVSTMAASLHHTYLFCVFCLHGLYSWDSIWVQNIDALGRTALENFSNKSEKCMHSLQPPIPDAWNKCVLASRCSVQLIMRDQEHHGDRRHNNNSLWFSTCLLFSALVIMLVNITYEPGHERALQDRQLAATGAAFLKAVLAGKGDTASMGLISVLRGLELAADKWTGYYAMDPSSLRPPLPAKGHDLFGNGILMMGASSSSSDSLLGGTASTESLIVSDNATHDLV